LNVKEKVFLGWEKGRDGIAKVAATKTPAEWFVHKLSDFTFSQVSQHRRICSG
jgi:hypothetical protein